jgi:hypothetical protein
MNFASNTAPFASTRPSRVAPIHRTVGWRTCCWISVMTLLVLAWYQRRFSSSVTKPSWTMRWPDKSSGSTSPRFSRQRRSRAASSSPMMMRASEPPMKQRRSAKVVPIGPGTIFWRFGTNDRSAGVSRGPTGRAARNGVKNPSCA